MKHLSDDSIQAFLLETLNPPQYTEVERHLKECEACREQLEAIRGEVAALAGMQTRLMEPPALPKSHSRRSTSLTVQVLRLAAVLMLGFLSGFGVASLKKPSCITVLPYVSSASGVVTTQWPVNCTPIYETKL